MIALQIKQQLRRPSSTSSSTQRYNTIALSLKLTVALNIAATNLRLQAISKEGRRRLESADAGNSQSSNSQRLQHFRVWIFATKRVIKPTHFRANDGFCLALSKIRVSSRSRYQNFHTPPRQAGPAPGSQAQAPGRRGHRRSDRLSLRLR
jgi:hypothetical protein